MLDIMTPKESMPYLVECLKNGVEPLVTTRTIVLVDRYLWGWKGMFHHNPARLTEEGAFYLYRIWEKP